MAGPVALPVLLPLRLETRFHASTLRLLVVPDQSWYDSHRPLPGAAELTALDQYLQVAGPQPALAPTAWLPFARQLGAARAAWLVRTFGRDRPDADGSWVSRPPILDDGGRFDRISGFPRELEVWLARGGRAPVRAATTTIDPARLRVDPPDPTKVGDERWWSSWDEAVRAGLGTEIDLGLRSDDIDVLYVVGIGGADATTLLGAHRDAGRLGVLPLGAATNTVDGRPAADLGSDPETWRSLLDHGATAVEQQISTALTGDPSVLGPLPGESPLNATSAGLLVAGLWPALWGYGLREVLGLSAAAVWDAQIWAGRHLHPVGPFPALRIGQHPYGLLPASSLAAWQPAPNDPAVEQAMIAPLATLRARWAGAAERAGRTAEGADSTRLVDVVAAPPASPGYSQRRMHPLELWYLALLGTGTREGWSDVLASWAKANPLARALKLQVARRYSDAGRAEREELPLVVPAGLPAGITVSDVLAALVRVAVVFPAQLADTTQLEDEVLRMSTRSLLLRLAVRALQLAVSDVGRVKLGLGPPAAEPVAVDAGVPPELVTAIRAVTAGDLAVPGQESAAFQQVASALQGLTTVPPEELERLLPFTVDTAAYRVDPWVIGPPVRRLAELTAQGASHVLGAYGWVDRPGPDRPGPPGPGAGGLLHTPSATQAATAALLRDRAVNDPEPVRWRMDLTSTTVRAAARLAEEVRRGSALTEVLGREVERAVGDPAAVEHLRSRFPIRIEHAGRRVCDGTAVLAEPTGALGVGPQAAEELDRLRAAVDAYGDLLVAESALHVVEGRADTAGAAMEAAAGFARPPVMDVLRTRREGRSVGSTCLVVLPDSPAPVLPADALLRAELSPGTIADPAAAAEIRRRIGAGNRWRWTVRRPGHADVEITLADLGLEPVDALAHSRADLELLVLAAAPTGPVAGADPVVATRDGSIRYDRAARLVAVWGQNPPTDDGDRPGATAEIAAELRQRLAALRDVATALTSRLGPAAGPADLRLATAWGIAPDQADGVAVRKLLLGRLDAAPTAESAAALGPAELAKAITALASRTGQLAVLGRLPRASLPQQLERPDPATGWAGVEASWLPVVAAVRPALARLEAYQLVAGTPQAADPPMALWTNRPDDPWQLDPTTTDGLVVAACPADLDLGIVAPGGVLAIGVVDRFVETIPAQQHTTAAAFDFRTPDARAPAAVLLVVPPDVTHTVDVATAVRIVAETRELGHARMARPADLGGTLGLIPLTYLPATGSAAVPLR